jgi:hypothetical protein
VNISQAKENLVSGFRTPSANSNLGIDAFVCVATEEVAPDLERLIPTVAFFAPDTPFHLVCDRQAFRWAKRISDGIGYKNITLHQWLNAVEIANAESRVRGIAHSPYWKRGPIWWKIEALRRVLDHYRSQKGVLLVDSDIVFINPLGNQRYGAVDAVLSPFYWPTPEWYIEGRPGGNLVQISARDGFYNAGYLLAGSASVAEFWLQLYEDGRGGFYEQKCLEYFPQAFRCGYFGPEHNFGQWRRELPIPGTVSVHAHAWSIWDVPFHNEIQRVANQSSQRALRALTSHLALTQSMGRT